MVAEVECVFNGALFLEKVTCARKRFFFFKNWRYFDISITLTARFLLAPIYPNLNRFTCEQRTANVQPQTRV